MEWTMTGGFYFTGFFNTINFSFLIYSPKIQREPKMILPATATLATTSHCSAVETSPSMPGPSNKCDFGASEPMPQQPQQRSALTTLPTAPAAGTGKSFNWTRQKKKNPEWYYLKEKKKKKKIRRISQMNTHFFFATIYDEQTNLSDAIKSCRFPFFQYVSDIYLFLLAATTS